MSLNGNGTEKFNKIQTTVNNIPVNQTIDTIDENRVWQYNVTVNINGDNATNARLQKSSFIVRRVVAGSAVFAGEVVSRFAGDFTGSPQTPRVDFSVSGNDIIATFNGRSGTTIKYVLNIEKLISF